MKLQHQLYSHRALRHLPGFGPKKIARLHRRGIYSWDDLLHHHCELPGLHANTPEWVTIIRNSQQAVSSGNIQHLTGTFHRSDQWRILADFLQQATYLDIETSGDQYNPEITLIICKHRGKLRTYTAERNLHQFLELLDEISLLVTFNGTSFDVPQLEHHFRIPMRDIPHIDLRWVCYHEKLRGGLKQIERAIGLTRPQDLIGIDGADAAWLWQQWKETENPTLIHRLTRYCAADVIGLEHLSRWIIAKQGGLPYPIFDWNELPVFELK